LYPDLAARIRAVPYDARASFQSLSHATGVPATTLWRRYKAGFFKKYTRPLKPALTTSNKYVRMDWALRFIDADNLVNNMEHVVHIDEKWFYIKRPVQKVANTYIPALY